VPDQASTLYERAIQVAHPAQPVPDPARDESPRRSASVPLVNPRLYLQV
jgi:hypothetical protein